ncbi:DEAD/DEAH box helicase family protein [Brachyspira intermedia]|uniref:hypothetical protein n=1 Tax=Brachyspira intermedia TaxID=84377 RepID=UPI0030071F4E
MFYSIIEKSRDIWYLSNDCKIKYFISYIENKNKLRNIQIDAIKTYLFLKIECCNRPLWELFFEGKFNNILNIEDIELKEDFRKYLLTNPSALSLYQYALFQKDIKEKNNLENEIKKNYKYLDYKKIFQEIFYKVDYTDYLFSLPMGAGKTFLMACFIYIDLYFSINEPDNKIFSHNFLILAPSGLKSSIIPSLKTIENFDISWLIPEPAASKVKKLIKFEILDENKSSSKSNKIINPNARKITYYEPLNELAGLIAITNAEKVILNKLDKSKYKLDFNESYEEEYNDANELRAVIGKIPNLSIYIDEVHHAVDEDIKLRYVVNNWTSKGTINSVIGFSGTPYINKSEKIEISNSFFINSKEITNTVYYYPLHKGIGKFLKVPKVEISSSNDRLDIIDNALRNFLDKYKDKVYSDGTIAKLAIYCGNIEVLEEIIYPKVVEILNEYNINSNETVLKYHKGNKNYKEPENSQMEFNLLDNPISKKRIILLVQIGKEGWDCKSLTGVVLSQKKDCPENMVLQTSCRCLRQINKNEEETALIYLNKENAQILKSQLSKEHHISINEFQTSNRYLNEITVKRYNRMDKIKIPPIDFYQLSVSYDISELEKKDTKKLILNSYNNCSHYDTVETSDFSFKEISTHIIKKENTKNADLNLWIYNISKKSFNILSIEKLMYYYNELKEVFDNITIIKNDNLYFKADYDINKVESNIIKSFFDKRKLISKEEIIKEEAQLLIVKNFTSELKTDSFDNLLPHNNEEIEKIIYEDNNELVLTEKDKQLIEELKKTGNADIAKLMENKKTPHKYKDKTYHYIPYKTDSRFEIKFFNMIVSLDIFHSYNLEIYYNGDDILTDFKIKTYKKTNNNWKYIGLYVPDFLIIKRENSEIKKILIAETKGEIYSYSFNDKKEFMKDFIINNNKKFNYNRFEFLYLEDSMKDDELKNNIIEKIQVFFGENN